MSLTGAGKIAGVMGWPVAQSLSPLLHGYWLREKQIDGALVPLAVRPEDFSPVLMALRQAGFAGVNATVPHKEAAFALAGHCDATAAAAGAANLLLFGSDGRIEARNTDAVGLRESLRADLGNRLAGKSAVLVGAGGAARGAVLALAELGIATIHILNRHADRAKALCGALAPMVTSRLIPSGLDGWEMAAGGAALLLNASSAGMNGGAPLDLALESLAKDAVVCDMVYKPLETDLLKRARARGHLCLDGLGMLMHQAAPSFEAFFGVRPEVTQGLRAALEQALASG